jgi:hypothetical protein
MKTYEICDGTCYTNDAGDVREVFAVRGVAVTYWPRMRRYVTVKLPERATCSLTDFAAWARRPFATEE